MKRIWLCLALLLACIFVLAGCGAGEETTAMTGTADSAVKKELAASPTFAAALDENGFAPGGGFIDKLDVWTYEDKPLRKHGDLVAGCGVTGGVETFHVKGVCNGSDEFQTSDDQSYADRSLNFSMYVPIDGVVMPYGMTFDNTLDELLKQLGFEAELSSDEETILEHVSIPDYESKLILTCQTDSESGLHDYLLKFFEDARSDRYAEGCVSYYTRTLSLGFEAGTNRLNYLSFDVTEKNMYHREMLTKTPTFSEALDQNGFKSDMTESDFAALLEKATYRGVSLDSYDVANRNNDISTLTHLSVTDVCWGEYYGYSGRLEDMTETKRSSLSFSVPIGEIVLPYGMTFGHTLYDLLATMGYADFSVSENDAWTTMLGDVTFYDYTRAPETEAHCPEGVRYAVSYSIGTLLSSDSENPVNIEFTRKMTLYFAEETGYLSFVSMSILEKTK